MFKFLFLLILLFYLFSLILSNNLKQQQNEQQNEQEISLQKEQKIKEKQQKEQNEEYKLEEYEEIELKKRYPWNQKYQIKQNYLLNKLKNNNLNILSNYLPSELKENNLYFSYNNKNNNNNNNNNYTCLIVPEKTIEILSKTQNEERTLNLIKNICLSYNVDWWSYEWCSELEVHQFHVEIIKKNSFQKNPNWSLGKYDFTEYERDENDQINRIIQYYSGGQICHENNHLRSSEIHLVCCDKNKQDLRSPLDIPLDQLATYSAQHETSLCEYQIELCSPLVCPSVMYHSTNQQQVQYSLVEFMKAIEKTCMTRVESWWTYEVCFLPSNIQQEQTKLITDNNKKNEESELNSAQQKFTSGARQFRVNTILVQEGKNVKYSQVIEAEFFLGSPPLNLYKNETALREAVVAPRSTVVHRVGSSLSHQSSSLTPTAALHIEFTGGKECDIENTLRGATMEITCGTRDGIEDIIEDRTCHYLFKISSQALCLVEGFAPPKQNISQIVCQPSTSTENNKLNEKNIENLDNKQNQIINEEQEKYQKDSINKQSFDSTNNEFRDREL